MLHCSIEGTECGRPDRSESDRNQGGSAAESGRPPRRPPPSPPRPRPRRPKPSKAAPPRRRRQGRRRKPPRRRRRSPHRRAAKKTIKQAKPAKKPATARTARKAKPARAGATDHQDRSEDHGQPDQKTAETGKIAAEQFTAVFGDVNARAKTALEKSAKIVEELADLTRGNVEAIVASSKVAAKGVETLGQDAAEYSRKSFEDASAALKSFAEVKSATDFFRLQGDFARSAFDAAVAESARLSARPC